MVSDAAAPSPVFDLREGGFRVGPWQVEVELHRLVQASATVRVEPKSMAVLCRLAEEAGEVVSREELLRSVWAERFVTEEVLTHAIWDLRRALGDHPRHPTFIQTLPKRGYRLLVTPTRGELLPRADRRSEERRIGSIAVLPFADMSAEQDQGYFCDGIAEELIISLARIEGLRVASRTSAFHFNDNATDIREIGRLLTVATVLEGSVRKVDERLRITAELVDTADGCQLWSKRFDRRTEDIFAIQEEIASSIVEALEITLSQPARRALREAPTRNARAYDFYLRGRRYFYRRGTKRDHEIARQLYRQATELDPAFARAHAGNAICSAYVHRFFDNSKEFLAEADRASQRAVALDPDLAEARLSRGLVLAAGRRWSEADGEFEAALRLDAELFEASYFYGHHCFSRGRFAEAVELFQTASTVRPEDYQTPILLAICLQALGRVDEAAAARRQGLARAEERLAMTPDDVRALYLGANAWIALGQPERGMEWAERALAMDPEESPYLLYNIACLYALVGEADEAIRCLARAIEGGIGHFDAFETDPDLDTLRDDRRFQALVRELEASLRSSAA